MYEGQRAWFKMYVNGINMERSSDSREVSTRGLVYKYFRYCAPLRTSSWIIHLSSKVFSFSHPRSSKLLTDPPATVADRLIERRR